MTIKNIIFCSLVCVGFQICAMHSRYNSKSLAELAWERHQQERRQYFETLGQPMPEGETFEEAMKQHLRNKLENDAAMHEEIKQHRESHNNEIIKK